MNAPRPRARQDGTWITRGWRRPTAGCTAPGTPTPSSAGAGADLAGGLYGVAIGRVFFGESMFSRVSDASKARSRTCAHSASDSSTARSRTPHLARLGAVEMERRRFLAQLDALCEASGPYEAAGIGKRRIAMERLGMEHRIMRAPEPARPAILREPPPPVQLLRRSRGEDPVPRPRRPREPRAVHAAQPGRLPAKRRPGLPPRMRAAMPRVHPGARPGRPIPAPGASIAGFARANRGPLVAGAAGVLSSRRTSRSTGATLSARHAGGGMEGSFTLAVPRLPDQPMVRHPVLRVLARGEVVAVSVIDALSDALSCAVHLLRPPRTGGGASARMPILSAIDAARRFRSSGCTSATTSPIPQDALQGGFPASGTLHAGRSTPPGSDASPEPVSAHTPPPGRPGPPTSAPMPPLLSAHAPSCGFGRRCTRLRACAVARRVCGPCAAARGSGIADPADRTTGRPALLTP